MKSLVIKKIILSTFDIIYWLDFIPIKVKTVKEFIETKMKVYKVDGNVPMAMENMILSLDISMEDHI